jgi:hypothetical protein
MVYSSAMWQSDEYSSESKSIRLVRIEYHDPSETVTSLIRGAQSKYLFLVTRYGTDVRKQVSSDYKTGTSLFVQIME